MTRTRATPGGAEHVITIPGALIGRSHARDANDACLHSHAEGMTRWIEQGLLAARGVVARFVWLRFRQALDDEERKPGQYGGHDRGALEDRRQADTGPLERADPERGD